MRYSTALKRLISFQYRPLLIISRKVVSRNNIGEYRFEGQLQYTYIILFVRVKEGIYEMKILDQALIFFLPLNFLLFRKV